MDRTLANFIRALRNAEVRISTAETLDAFNTVELVGYRDRALLKRSLALALPKTIDEKEAFDACFDQFFSVADVRGERPREGRRAEQGGASERGEGAGGGGGAAEEPKAPETGGADGQPRRPGGKKAKHSLRKEEDEPELGPGRMSAPTSALGELLMQDSRVELTMAVSAAGEVVEVREIQVFTQKGLYTRRIMDHMGLAELNREIADAQESPAVPRRRLGQELRRRREWLREQVRDYVERQFLLHADASGKRLREELLRKVKLSNVERDRKSVV